MLAMISDSSDQQVHCFETESVIARQSLDLSVKLVIRLRQVVRTEEKLERVTPSTITLLVLQAASIAWLYKS